MKNLFKILIPILLFSFSLSEKKELEAIKKALKRSSSQWEHDGMNQPPKNFRAIDILKKVFEKKYPLTRLNITKNIYAIGLLK